jgi:hypothetical protein
MNSFSISYSYLNMFALKNRFGINNYTKTFSTRLYAYGESIVAQAQKYFLFMFPILNKLWE